MNRLISLVLLAIATCSYSCSKPLPQDDIVKLAYENGKSIDYYQLIDYYQQLADAYPQARLIEAGATDVGKPLYLFIMSNEGAFDFKALRNSNKPLVLVNNGIHPGEPCGMEASLQFGNDLLRNKDKLRGLLDTLNIAIVPVYSAGGMLKRSAYIRTNQATPEYCGRRGNGRNIDLNRDFSKQDTRNAQSMAQLFQSIDPDVFLDTHTTNGSDHQHTITLIPVQPSSMHPAMGAFMRDTLLPQLYANMSTPPYDLIPYVIYDNSDPANGIISYMQSPRVSTGFANLFNVFGFMTENHVYKPYADRVNSVYKFIRVLCHRSAANGEAILAARKKAADLTRKQKQYTLTYTLDTSQWQPLTFRGYETGQVLSDLTGLTYRGYDHNKPYTREVPFYNVYRPDERVEAPDYYLVPQAWSQVVERLQWNGVQMQRIANDTTLLLPLIYITDHAHYPSSSNGRYYHHKITTEQREEPIRVYRGDYLIPVNQPVNRYIVQMLEPKARDSFMRWGFFDPCLEARDWNNPRPSFEANAREYLQKHPALRKVFDEKRTTDKTFANDHAAQLAFIFQRSPWAHRIVGRYPVLRLQEALPVYGQ